MASHLHFGNRSEGNISIYAAEECVPFERWSRNQYSSRISARRRISNVPPILCSARLADQSYFPGRGASF